VLNATPHESFERNGSDLLTHVNLTLSEALLGFSRIILTHLDGRGIKFSSPPGNIIKSDDAIVLRGEGMPVHKRPDEKGNLYVMFEIEMPTPNWLMSVDKKVRTHYLYLQWRQAERKQLKALESLLPPKRSDVDPQPEVVDEPEFEASDIVEVRSRSFPASANFFDHCFSQFGENENDWEDDGDDDDDDGEPECRPQ
jgi:DnaJ family protein A protein 2